MNKNHVIMIDNDSYFLKKWESILGKEVTFYPYSSLSEFEDDLEEGKIDIHNSVCVIVDFEFPNTNAGKRDFATFLRETYAYKNPILMCSLHDCFDEYDELIRNTFSLVIDKTPLTWLELESILKKLNPTNKK